MKIFRPSDRARRVWVYFLLSGIFLGVPAYNAELVVKPGDAVRRELEELRRQAPKLAMPAPASLPVPSPRLIDESRLLFYLADLQPDESADSRGEWMESGRAKAELARERDPKNPAAVFWWAANEGGLARLRRGLSSLHAISRLEKVLLQLREEAPSYGYGAADRMLCAIYLAAPAIISIGSNSKAEDAAQRAKAQSADFPGNQVAWIDVLKARGRDEEALAAARALVKSEAWKRTYGEFEYDRTRWTEQLKKILPAPESAALASRAVP